MQGYRLAIFIVFLPVLLFAQDILNSDLVYEPTSSGILYPIDMKDLTGQVKSFLDQSHKCRENEYPSVIIVPGASYLYIGGLLADAYKQVGDMPYDAIVIIAPSCDNKTKGVSVFPGRYYRSLLGSLQANESVVTNILSQGNNLIGLSNDGFRGNRFIDVQLPFIQYVFGNRDIVTLAVGDLKPEQLDGIAESITNANNGLNVLYIIATNGRSTTSIKEMNLYNKSVCRNIQICEMISTEKLVEKAFNLQENEIVFNLGLIIAHKINARSADVYRINNATGLNRDRQTYETYVSAGLYVSDSTGIVADESKLDLSEYEANIITDYIISTLETRIAQKARLKRLPPDLARKHFGIYIKITREGEIIANGAELFSNLPLPQTIESVLDYIIFSDPLAGRLDMNELQGSTVEIILTSRGKRFLPGDSYPRHGLVYLKYKNYSSMNFIGNNAYSGEKVLRDLCLKAGLLYDCWQDDAARVFVFDSIERKRRLR